MPVAFGLPGDIAERVDPQGCSGRQVLTGDVAPGVHDVGERRLGGAWRTAELMDHHAGDAVAPAGRDRQPVRQPFEAPAADVDAVDVCADQLPPGVGPGELDAGEPAHGGSLAVAPDDVRGGDPYRNTAGPRRLDHGPVGVLLQTGDPVAASHLGAEPYGPGTEDHFGAGLRDLPLPRVRSGQPQVQRMAAEVAHGLVRRGSDLVQQPSLVEDLHGAGVERGRAGLGRRCVELVQHDHVRTAEPQFPGEHQPDGARAHDDDIRARGDVGPHGISAVLRHSPWRGRGWRGCWC